MEYFTVFIDASFNLPKEMQKKFAIDLRGLPYSSLRGLLYAFLGERPPSFFDKSTEFFKVEWIDEIVNECKYIIFDKNQINNFSQLQTFEPKLEQYFGRSATYDKLKQVTPDATLMGKYKDFLKELLSLYETSKAYVAMNAFENDCSIFFSKNPDLENDEFIKAKTRIEHLRRKEADLARQGVIKKNGWSLSDGYLKIFQNRQWLSYEHCIDGKYIGSHHFGICGRPIKKMTFNALVHFPIPDNVKDKFFEKIEKSIKVATFGENGVAYSVPIDSKEIESNEIKYQYAFHDSNFLVYNKGENKNGK